MTQRTTEWRVTLHSHTSNTAWIIIFFAVNGVLFLGYHLYGVWQMDAWQPQDNTSATTMLVLVGMIAYCTGKTRWLIARPGGLEVTEGYRIRVFPWDQVTIEELGLFGRGPGTRRYYLDLPDGQGFTFFGDPDAIAKLPSEARFIPSKGWLC